jgi:hypothetical protein
VPRLAGDHCALCAPITRQTLTLAQVSDLESDAVELGDHATALECRIAAGTLATHERIEVAKIRVANAINLRVFRALGG